MQETELETDQWFVAFWDYDTTFVKTFGRLIASLGKGVKELWNFGSGTTSGSWSGTFMI
jgi:hypothetical protein